MVRGWSVAARSDRADRSGLRYAMVRRRLPIGIQTFRELRERDCYYVDKTAYIKRLLDAGKHYFLSRPRRFGKSLFLDTLKEFFEGNQELFAGLYIHDRHDWTERHPVVRLSFGGGNFKEPGYLDTNVMAQLDGIEVAAGVSPRYATAPERFGYLIRSLHQQTGQRVAVLVDEYDKPILDALVETPEVARANRDYLRGLYGVIKDSDAHVGFTFLTGISKFSKVNLFSQLNNLTDLTLDRRYSAICGYTERDLDTVFAPELGGLDRERVREWYNGYSWRGTEKVYNPYDLLLLFDSREFAAHWFETGTPAFLVDTLFERRVSSVSLDEMVSTAKLLSAFDVGSIGTEALLFQTGYLTITGEETLGGMALYRLGYPNREVRQSLNEYLLSTWCRTRRSRRRTAYAWRGCWRRSIAKACGSCSTRSSRASRTNGTRTTTSRTTRASTRACSTPTSRRWGTRSWWKSRAATGGWTWRCAPAARCTCSSSRSWSWRRRALRWRSCGSGTTRPSTAAEASPIHLIGVEFSRDTRNVTAFEVADG